MNVPSLSALPADADPKLARPRVNNMRLAVVKNPFSPVRTSALTAEAIGIKPASLITSVIAAGGGYANTSWGTAIEVTSLIINQLKVAAMESV